MGKVVFFNQSFLSKKPAGSLQFFLEEKKGERFVVPEVSQNLKKFVQERKFLQKYLDEMVLKKTNVCPVLDCQGEKDENFWVCADCHRQSGGVLTKIARKYVLKKVIENGMDEIIVDEKGEFKKNFSKAISDMAMEKIKIERFSGEDVYLEVLKEFSSTSGQVSQSIRKQVESVNRKLKQEGYIPFHLWNELFEKFGKFKKPKISMEERSRQGIVFFVKNIIPKKEIENLNLDKTIENLLVAHKRHRENSKNLTG